MRYAKVLGSTLTAIGLASAMTACATPGGAPRSAGGFNVMSKNIALATRAQLAIASNDLASAVSLAEQAVEKSPRDAGFRALLGNAYLASGRYASAEAAYRDALGLYGNQPEVVLKLALVQIALGKNGQAIGLLQGAGGIVDAADRGLALALAGDPAQAVQLLQDAARQPGADARLRQNLALASAMAGDWESARVIAGQDLAPDQVEQRIAEWMSYTSPEKANSRVASFIGIPMSPADPGQPVRFALTRDPGDTRMAQAAPVVAPAPLPAPVEVAEAAPIPVPSEPVQFAAYDPAPVAMPAPVEVAEITPLAPPAPPPRVVERSSPASVTVALPKARPAKVVQAEVKAPRPALSRRAAPVDPSLVRKASIRTGSSSTVVQLGAYSSRDRVEIAWNKAVGRFGSLRGLTPVTARFDAAKGSVYRLSVKGFASDREAMQLCGALKRSGRECFVRRASGDAPVSFASRS